MVKDEQAQVIAAFRDQALVRQTVEQLRAAGWQEGQIQVLGERSQQGGLLSAFRHHSPADNQEGPGLEQLNLSDEQRAFYQRELEAGYAVVAVEAHGRQDQVRDILQRHGGYNLTMPYEIKEGTRTIPIREERLDIEKQAVQIGELRIHKRVITEEKTFKVPVTREEVTIERIPIKEIEPVVYRETGEQEPEPLARPAGSAGDPTVQQYGEPHSELEEILRNGGDVRIVVREEQVTIAKQPIVVEEIVIRKRPFEETRQIVEQLRHEEVSVERDDTIPVYGKGGSVPVAGGDEGVTPAGG